MHPVIPKAAWLTVNRNCNFRCSWCYGRNTQYDSKKDMPLSLATELINLIVDAGVQKLLLIGGEPTLWTHLFEINAYCKQKGIQTILVTNALRFSNDDFWQRYLESPNDVAGISLKAGNSNQLVKTTGVKRFDLMQKGVMRAIDRFKTGVTITYNMHYRDFLPDMAKFAMDCGALSVKIDFCMPSFADGKATKQDMIDPHDLVRDIIASYDELDGITGGHLNFEMHMPLCIWPKEFVEMLKSKKQILSVCHVLKRHGIIFDSNGGILVCNGLFDYPIGQYGKDFVDAAGLTNFLNSPRIVGCYDRLACYPSRICTTCSIYDDCGGGCPLRWTVYDPNKIITRLAY